MRKGDVQRLLKKHGIRPQKRLGQHFLVDSRALERVVRAASFTGRETVLEVGAGLGVLTRRLSEEVARVVAVEVDSRLLPALDEVLRGCGNIELVLGDILEFDWLSLIKAESYQVVANIPYHITSALIRSLLEAPQPAERIVLMVQREVSARILASPGEMNLLALSVQLYGSPHLVSYIPPKSFFPQPRVDSAIMRIDIHQSLPFGREWIEPIFKLARAGFSQRRKQLRNSLAAGLQIPPPIVVQGLEAAGIPKQARAQELRLEEWRSLAEEAERAWWKDAGRGSMDSRR